MADNDDDYEVGYKKPPKNTQFKKGQSGNPNGRPKGTLNFRTDLKEELSQIVQVNEGGTVQRLTKQRAMQKRTVQLALQGNIRATELVVKWHAQYLDMEEETNSIEELSNDDQAILDRFRKQQGTNDEDDTL